MKTIVDDLFDYIAANSPVKEKNIPSDFRMLKNYEYIINVLEQANLIEVKLHMLSEREFKVKR